MRIVIAQVASAKGDPAANLQRMEKVIREAAEKQADIVCFAELFYSGYDVDKETLKRCAIRRNGPEIGRIKEMAKEFGIHVLISYPEQEQTGGPIYISAILLDNRGRELLNHRKTYRWDDEKNKVSVGTDYSVCDTVFGKVGILICYEMEFPEPGRILAMKGAEILLVTSAFDAVHEMQRYLCALAIQNQYWVVGVNDVLPDAVREGRPSSRGCSCIVDPFGGIMAELGEGVEEVLYYDLDTRTKDRRAETPHMKDLNAWTFDMLADCAKARLLK